MSAFAFHIGQRACAVLQIDSPTAARDYGVQIDPDAKGAWIRGSIDALTKFASFLDVTHTQDDLDAGHRRAAIDASKRLRAYVGAKRTAQVTLPEVLRDVLHLVGDIGCDHVTIARPGDHSYQVRFTPDKECARGYRIEGRRWMDERTYVGWARWSSFLGFGVDAIRADDWRIL